MSSSHTEALTDLKRQLAEENVAARTADAEVQAAEGELATAREAVVWAYADQDTAAAQNAMSARDNAEARVSKLAVKQEAARLRVRRAEQAAQAYEAEHALELIAELEPAGDEAAEAMEHHFAEAVAADRRWRTVSTEVSRLLAHVPGATPARTPRASTSCHLSLQRSARPETRSSHRCPPGGACATTSRSRRDVGCCASSAPASTCNLWTKGRQPDGDLRPGRSRPGECLSPWRRAHTVFQRQEGMPTTNKRTPLTPR
jgi:hypothetical protein